MRFVELEEYGLGLGAIETACDCCGMMLSYRVDDGACSKSKLDCGTFETGWMNIDCNEGE